MKRCRTMAILSILLIVINYIYISLVKGSNSTTATPLYLHRGRKFGAYSSSCLTCVTSAVPDEMSVCGRTSNRKAQA
jgi:hypothetical protein